MSMRRFSVLLRGLPMEARTRFEENGGWTRADHLLATNAELVHGVYRATLAGRVRDLPKPLKLPRPTDPKPKKVRPRELVRMMLRGGR